MAALPGIRKCGHSFFCSDERFSHKAFLIAVMVVVVNGRKMCSGCVVSLVSL